ncbi:MAG: glycosyltransferase [Bacteroidales bacterium]|nr:glycosyltransferase [Bacteroidales bacterium]
MELSVIIPVYRGGILLKELNRRIIEALNEHKYEILFICDKCDDDSFQIVNGLKKDGPARVKVYSFKENYGQHKALQFGFEKASGDLIITMDEDLQHDPSDIVKLIRKQKEGNYDIVYGRFTNLQHNGARIILSSVLRKVLKHFIPTLFEDYSPYRVIKREIAKSASNMVSPYTFIDDFLSRITQNIAFVDITHFKRPEGRSSYTLRKLIKHGIYILLAYSSVISWLLFAAGIIIFLGALLFIMNVILPETISTINNVSIIGIFGIGLLLIIISLLGTFINHRNIILNTRSVKLIDEDPI